MTKLILGIITFFSINLYASDPFTFDRELNIFYVDSSSDLCGYIIRSSYTAKGCDNDRYYKDLDYFDKVALTICGDLARSGHSFGWEDKPLTCLDRIKGVYFSQHGKKHCLGQVDLSEGESFTEENLNCLLQHTVEEKEIEDDFLYLRQIKAQNFQK